jgi:hypothetical protein
MQKQKQVNYFGFGTNRDLEMMENMVGRKNIKGEHAKLLGYEITIQKANQFRTDVSPTSPVPNTSPKDLILKVWGPDFEMFTSRPNPKGVAYGTIWYLSPSEFELVREWEIVDFGCQEDAYGEAITDDGKKVRVITQSLLKPAEIDRVISGDDYEPYIWNKKTMLEQADRVRKEYLNMKSRLPLEKQQEINQFIENLIDKV